MDGEKQPLLGEYFVVTSGYSTTGGLVNDKCKAIMFISEGNNLYRRATPEEVTMNATLHPILQCLE